jgi:DivIVA domain-containing protein
LTAHFPRTTAKKLGYEPVQVDQLIALARQQFAVPGSHNIDAKALRTAQFALVKGGYEIAAVDAALDRLDDAFAVQDAKKLVAQIGEHGATERVAELKALLEGRIGRPNRKHFKRNPWWLKGYSLRQVDAMVAAAGEQLAGKMSVPVATLREQTFKPKWGGYVENQVDAFIDKTVEYIQLSGALAI